MPPNTRPRALENMTRFAVARPADDRVGGAVVREPLGRAAGRRHHEHVVIAVAVRREGDPLAVGRELRMRIAGRVRRQPARDSSRRR